MFCSQILHPPSLSSGRGTGHIGAAIYLNPRIVSCLLYVERYDRQLSPGFFCLASSRQHITDAWTGSQRGPASTCCYTPVWQQTPCIDHRPAWFACAVHSSPLATNWGSLVHCKASKLSSFQSLQSYFLSKLRPHSSR